jgi:hypothetical protein
MDIKFSRKTDASLPVVKWWDSCGLKWVVGIFFILFLAWTTVASAEVSNPNIVQAAFIHKFTLFIDWPQSKTPAAGGKFRICMIGETPMRSALEILKGEKVGKGEVELFKITKPSQIPTCKILFISPTEKHRLKEIFQDTKDRPVLTISNYPGFASHGGMINFVVVEDKVRFEINLVTARTSGLKISSKLLRIAKIVTSK